MQRSCSNERLFEFEEASSLAHAPGRAGGSDRWVFFKGRWFRRRKAPARADPARLGLRQHLAHKLTDGAPEFPQPRRILRPEPLADCRPVRSALHARKLAQSLFAVQAPALLKLNPLLQRRNTHCATMASGKNPAFVLARIEGWAAPKMFPELKLLGQCINHEPAAMSCGTAHVPENLVKQAVLFGDHEGHRAMALQGCRIAVMKPFSSILHLDSLIVGLGGRNLLNLSR